MSDITSVTEASGQGTVGASGAGAQDPAGQGTKNQVSYESFQKALHEKKSAQAKLQEYESKLKELEQQKLQAEGKKDELLSQYQAELKALKTDLTKTKSAYAYKAVKSQVALKAKEYGCQDTDLLLKAMDLDGLQVSLVDEDYNVDGESLTTQLDAIRRDKPFLFKQAGPVVKDGVPSNSVPKSGVVDLGKMTTKELLEYAKRNAEKLK